MPWIGSGLIGATTGYLSQRIIRATAMIPALAAMPKIMKVPTSPLIEHPTKTISLTNSIISCIISAGIITATLIGENKLRSRFINFLNNKFKQFSVEYNQDEINTMGQIASWIGFLR